MVMRISGLASGMDIDEIVTNLMTAERLPLDKIYQKKTYTEWQRDDYRTMNAALLEFDTLIRDGVHKQASFIKKTVSVSDANAVSVKNINSVTDFSGTIKVNKLAEAATMFSTVQTPIVDPTKTLSTYSVAAQTITIQAINKDGVLDPTPYTLSIDPTKDTLNSVIEKINANSGVTVFYDQKDKHISVIAKNSGDIANDSEIKLSSTLGAFNGDFFQDILKLDNNNETAKTNSRGTAGVNAEIVYNGMLIKRTSNTFTINGAEITLKKQDPATSISFSSTPDVDSIYDTIKKFVDSYNGLIASISSKISERKNADYAPLTAAQKEDMKEDEIKLWEEKARKGTLRNDSTLGSLLTKMRSSIYTSVEGNSFGSLSKVGIATTNVYQNGGKLEIDETKLREAIAKDPNGVYELFMGNTTTSEGIAERLRSNLDSAMKNLSKKAGGQEQH